MSLWNPKKWVKARIPRSGAPVVPLYTVTKKFEEYEERVYPHTYWCTCLLHGMEQAKPIAFRRLMDYTAGYNARGERFQFSGPIVWSVNPKGEPVSVSIYMGLGPKAMYGTNATHWPPPKPTHSSIRVEQWPAMDVYVRYIIGASGGVHNDYWPFIPSKFSRFLDKSNCCWWPAPQPLDSELFVECWPAMIIYARPFRGQATKRDRTRETFMLSKNLPPVHKFGGYRMFCEYDDAIRPPSKRLNEVWFLAIA